jgi:hypothetical protein
MCLHDWGPSESPKWMAADVEELDLREVAQTLGEDPGDELSEDLGDALGDELSDARDGSGESSAED